MQESSDFKILPNLSNDGNMLYTPGSPAAICITPGARQVGNWRVQKLTLRAN
jgi:hypothetical protein